MQATDYDFIKNNNISPTITVYENIKSYPSLSTKQAIPIKSICMYIYIVFMYSLSYKNSMKAFQKEQQSKTFLPKEKESTQKFNLVIFHCTTRNFV